MILTCPNCGTQYVVKDGAIPPGGRQVRCASCKHSWHQDPEATESDRRGDALKPQRAGADAMTPQPTLTSRERGRDDERHRRSDV